MPQLFLAGVPATGKTWLGSWLAERGYIHIDAEVNGGADFDRASIHREWDNFIATGRATLFAEAAGALAKPVAVNWGLPLCYLYIIPPLQAAGFQAWWFNASYEAARKAFVAREQAKRESQRIPVERFERQMQDIQRQWSLISLLFGRRVISALRDDASQRPPDELWSEMVRAG